MEINRLPQLIFRYWWKGRRVFGRPKRRWRDKDHFEIQRNGP